ncbi:MAG: NmrA family transcriptional regulator, partial [Clostridia bacterium]|nr:NmrA family transcriptional regulator [Deltaproteobacteria bacterium]
MTLAIASATGDFDSFLQPIDQGFPMVATVDVGAEVARLLVEGWESRQVII